MSRLPSLFLFEQNMHDKNSEKPYQSGWNQSLTHSLPFIKCISFTQLQVHCTVCQKVCKSALMNTNEHCPSHNGPKALSPLTWISVSGKISRENNVFFRALLSLPLQLVQLFFYHLLQINNLKNSSTLTALRSDSFYQLSSFTKLVSSQARVTSLK